MQKRCANCRLPFECDAGSQDCWCTSVTAWKGVKEKSSKGVDAIHDAMKKALEDIVQKAELYNSKEKQLRERFP